LGTIDGIGIFARFLWCRTVGGVLLSVGKGVEQCAERPVSTILAGDSTILPAVDVEIIHTMGL
jgi:hypothetical protein